MGSHKHRILIVDDNRDIHEDFRKILVAAAGGAGAGADGLSDLEADLFGADADAAADAAAPARPAYELESAYQGQEGYEKVLASVRDGHRYALAFVDMRMPPGWDGVQTIEKIWEADPEVQVVICTAYSDYSWEAILRKLGSHDRMLILKKPFDTVEVCQLACALTEKWHLAKHAHLKLNQLKSMVDEQTHDLRQANQKLSEEIAERRRAERSLIDSMAQYQTSFELAAVGKAHADPTTGRFLQVNRKLCDLTGFTRDELLERTAEDVTHPDDRAADRVLVDRLARGESGDYFCEKRYVCKDGRVIWVNVTAALIRAADGRPAHTVAVIQDVTDRKLAEEQLRHDAMHDALTGLSNRALLMHRLSGCLARYRRDARHLFAVLYMDLDRFKVVNDGLGHLVGDQLLIGVARRLADVSRQADTLSRPAAVRGEVVRLGGDEFVLLLEDLAAPEDAVRVADRIRAALSTPFRIEGHEVFARSSIGIAVARPAYERPEEILRDADTALYRAKANRGSFAIFDQSMHEAALTRWDLEASLRRALERGELQVHYQPVVSLATGRVVELEALVRWQHPQRGWLPPGEFVPLAEDTGQILALGEWGLRTACLQAARWAAMTEDRVPVAVNLSGRQLARPELVDGVRGILAETGLAADLLRLELTESAIVENAEAAGAAVRQLRALGVQLQLDDFGTGYSSLSYLHRIPVDVLKIDRSFVATMGTDATSRSIVQVIVNLARTLGLSVIAEGVETEAQAAALAAMKCDFAQGYHFARPMPAAAATEFLLRAAAGPLLTARSA
ncbi:MAG: diguanylate cyclase [Phycisphaerales bacterium]|nr:diguanylate cyclase [Phycisphaerales bacterium]